MIQLHRIDARVLVIFTAVEAKNKLSRAFLLELLSVLEKVRAMRPHSLAFASRSSRIFAAGADMNELLQLEPEGASAYAELGQRVMAEIEGFSAPTYALVAGPCFGGGFDLALACDRIWAQHDALFCHPGARLGMITGFGGTVRLPRKLPPPMARFMLMTGYRMPAREAFRLGMVETLFKSHEAMCAQFTGRVPPPG